jgi:hypothetical protein
MQVSVIARRKPFERYTIERIVQFKPGAFNGSGG